METGGLDGVCGAEFGDSGEEADSLSLKSVRGDYELYMNND